MQPTAEKPRAFVGFPAYLDAARKRAGAEVAAADDARRQPALSQVASLVSQAFTAKDSPGRRDTIARARRLTAGLGLAHEAAARMLAEIDPPADDPGLDTGAPAGSPALKRPPKGKA